MAKDTRAQDLLRYMEDAQKLMEARQARIEAVAQSATVSQYAQQDPSPNITWRTLANYESSSPQNRPLKKGNYLITVTDGDPSQGLDQWMKLYRDKGMELFDYRDEKLTFKQGFYVEIQQVDSRTNQYIGIIQPSGQKINWPINGAESHFTKLTPTQLKKYLGEVEKKKTMFESVIIEQEKVEHIKEAISQKENTHLIFTQWGFGDVFEKGTAISLLFYGIPGTGKTLMAQAIADHLNMKLSIIGAADIQTSEPGGAERKIKGIFKDAKKDTVILLDECDSLLMDRNSVGHIMASQINTLLSEIEQFEGVVIFTTNRLGRLDAALERRISAKIEFVFPNKEARIKIWKRMIPEKAPLDSDVSLEKLAEIPLAGGNIKNAVLQAARRAAYLKKEKLDQASFLHAVDKELDSIQHFSKSKADTYRQGDMIASRDQNIVEGNYGEAMVQIEDYAKQKDSSV